jgi:outer membrane protein OmpA-like peptidoglycan-associated protein
VKRSIFLVLILVTSYSKASETITSTMPLETSSQILPQGWAPYVGLSSGYMSQGGDYKTEGVPTNVKFLGSYYSDNFVSDIGAGLQFQSMNKGSDPMNPILEMGSRYLLSDSLSAGPVVNTYMGQASRYGSANEGFTSFIGAQMMKEFVISGYDARAGLTAMTDLDIRSEQVNTIQANLQVGLGGRSERLSEKAIFSPSEENLEISTESSADANGTSNVTSDTTSTKSKVATPASHLIRAAGDMAWGKPVSHFSVNSAKLTPSGKLYLAKMATVLKKNNGKIKKITVVGHTDSSGTEKINKTLSIERAKAVSSFLKTKGMTSAKFELQGRAALEPISKDLATNRRSELKILGKADLSELAQQLKAIK